jgi:hypothetical protein
MIDDLLQGNEKFLADEFRPNAEYYHAIASRRRCCGSAVPTPG